MDNTANYQNNTQNFKFCRKCGRKLLADAEFCDSCGTRQISTETADIAETVSEPDVQYSNAQPVTPPPVYNGNNTTAGNAGVQYPQKKSKAPLIIGICVGVLLVIVSIIVTVLVVSSLAGRIHRASEKYRHRLHRTITAILRTHCLKQVHPTIIAVRPIIIAVRL